MKKRAIKPHLLSLLREYPAVAIVGPRQSGKTTLARSIKGSYYDLEREQDKLRLNLEFEKETSGKTLLILDEAQEHPDIFKRMRGAIDERRKENGRFLLLGSISPSLMRQVSESLAGRLALCELHPFILDEIDLSRADQLWLLGGYPDGGILKQTRFPGWQSNYLRLLVERDLPQWGLPSKPQDTHRLLKMLAALHGSIWNASKVGQNLGLSYHTVNTYLDYLEGAFLIRRLQPFHANLRKRLVKSPKVYWRDTGLLHSLLGITGRDSLFVSPQIGVSWEGFIIEQIIGFCAQYGIIFEPYYFRTSDGQEIDLVIKLDGKLIAVEVKLTATPGMNDISTLKKRAELINADISILITRCKETTRSHNCISADLKGALKALRKI